MSVYTKRHVGPHYQDEISSCRDGACNLVSRVYRHFMVNDGKLMIWSKFVVTAHILHNNEKNFKKQKRKRNSAATRALVWDLQLRGHSH